MRRTSHLMLGIVVCAVYLASARILTAFPEPKTDNSKLYYYFYFFNAWFFIASVVILPLIAIQWALNRAGEWLKRWFYRNRR